MWGKAKKAQASCPVKIGNIHHIGQRESQQDSFSISELSNSELCSGKGVFAVVADGMGGMEGGGTISNIVTQTMLRHFNETPEGRPAEVELLDMLIAANDNVAHYLKDNENGGSTVVAVIIRDGSLFWVAVGDSRIYLLRQGAAIQINREHTYAVELDEKAAMGEISFEDARGDSQRSALTSYIGMKTLEKIDRNLRPVRLVDGDLVLLMSDGVFGALDDDEILEAMTDVPQKSAANLQKRVLEKQNPNQDNFTAVIFEYRGGQS